MFRSRARQFGNTDGFKRNAESSAKSEEEQAAVCVCVCSRAARAARNDTDMTRSCTKKGASSVGDVTCIL